MTRWHYLCTDRALPFVFISAGKIQHRRSCIFFSAPLSALRYTQNSPLRPRHPLLRTKHRAVVIFAFSAVMVILGFLRLAGDLRRHCRRGHLLVVREVIANPAVPLDCAAVAGAAGGKPLNRSGFLSDGKNTVPGSVPTKPELNALIID